MEGKTILLIVTYLVGAGELVLAGFFWITRQGQEIRKVMGWLCLSIGFWVITNGLLIDNIGWLPRLIFIAGMFALHFLLHLVIIFPVRKFHFDKIHLLLFYAVPLFFSYAILNTDTVIVNFQNVDNTSITVGGELFPLFKFYLLLLYFLSIFFLIRRIRLSNGHHRSLSTLFMYSIVLGGIPAMLFNVLNVFPNLSYNAVIGPIFSGLWLITIIYIIWKK